MDNTEGGIRAQVAAHEAREGITAARIVGDYAGSAVIDVTNGLAVAVNQLCRKNVVARFEAREVERFPKTGRALLAIEAVAHLPVFGQAGHNRLVNGGVGQPKVKHDRLSTVAACGAAVGQERQFGLGRIFGGGC